MTRSLLTLLLLALPLTARGQEACPDGTVTNIFVDNRSIYDLDEIEGVPFAWVFRWSNRLHMRTRSQFIRRELLFTTGSCFDPFRLQDSERILRRYSFISRADVFGIRQPDGDWHVIVDTQDEWTTKVDVGVALDSKLEFRKLELAEENFLGRGMVVGAFVRETDAARLVGGRLFTPRLFNSRLDGNLTGGRTRIGTVVEQEFFWPFVGEVGRVAARQFYRRAEDYFTYSVGSRDEPTHVLVPIDEERIEVTFAARVGTPGNLTVFGLGVSRDRLEFPDFPGSVRVARNNDFSNTDPAPDELASAVTGQTRYASGTRVNFLLGQRNISFVRREGLDALRGVQDIEVGTDMSLTLGRSLGVLASEGRPDDLYTRFRLYAAGASSPFVVVSNVGIEGRQIFSGAAVEDGWRDVVAELDLLAYWQPGFWPRHTFFGRVSGAGGWQMDQPFQLTLGGATGVRGFHDEDFPGGRRVVFSAEDRIFVGWPFPDLFDLGATFFADVGRIWTGDAPFGEDSGWRGTVGAGLRVGFPAGTRSVLRIDAGLPLAAGAGLSDIVLRISVGDLIGLAGGFQDRQLQRSQRVTVGPDRFTPLR